MGLLDFLQGDDARLGIGLLAAGGPTTDPNQTGIGQRIQTAVRGVDFDRQNALRLKLLQSQVEENASQDALRRAQLDQQARRDAYLMGAPGGAAVPGASSGIAGLPGTPGGAAPVAGDRFSQYAAQTGIPRDAFEIDYMTNGGKGIAAMLEKRGASDMQVSGNYAYDKNKLQPGYLPSLNISQDGKSSMVQIGPDGLPVVSAPRGAVETFGAYQGAQANYKPIKVYNPQTGREEYTSEGAVVGGGRPAPMAGGAGNVQSAGYSGGDRNSANAESIRMIQSEMQKPGNSPQDMAAMQREIARLQQQSGRSGNYAAGPSATEAARAKAAEAKLVDTAKADVVRDTGQLKKEKSAGEMIAATRRARELLQQGPTGSGLGEMADKTAAFFGKSTAGGETAAKLDIVAGDLVNNVPRMEGPQSDGDRLEYKLQAGRAADRSLPPKVRLSAMDEVERLQMKYAKQNGGAESGGDAPKEAPKSFKDHGYASKADALKDAQNAMMKNPKAKDEILRRLQAMGVELPGKTGSW